MTGKAQQRVEDAKKSLQDAGLASTKQEPTAPSESPSATDTQKQLQGEGVAATVGTSASGQAAAGDAAQGQETAGEGGSGAEEVTDTILKPQGPIGLQKEPALFTRNGSVELNMVPSPTGPIPASLITDEKARQAALDATVASVRQGPRRNSRLRLSREQLERMSPAEVRAVAHDRGYDIGEGGRRGLVNKFYTAQQDDDSLDEPQEADLQGSPTIPIPGTFGGGLAATGPVPAVGGLTAFNAAGSASSQAAADARSTETARQTDLTASQTRAESEEAESQAKK